MKNIAKLSMLAVAVATLSACNDDDDAIVDPQLEKYQSLLSAMGGEQAVKSVEQLFIEVEGKSYDSHESPEPDERLIAEYSYTLTASVDAKKVRQEWDIDTHYAFATDLNFTEVINTDKGVVLDGPNTFASYAFGSFGVPAEEMTSSKVGARQKSMFMSSPVAIVSQMLKQDAIDLSVEFQGHKITLVLDNETGLPSSAQTTEYDPLLGDIIYTVNYSDWHFTQDLQYPRKITHMMEGEIVREEWVSSVTFTDEDETLFSFHSDDASEVVEQKLKAGYDSSLYFTRGMMMGFPFDAVHENNVVSEFIDDENKVLRITGIEHYNYAFLIEDKVFIYDAPISNERQLAVLNEVTTRFPGKDVGGVVLSHNHFDHAGGFRAALSKGGDLITGESSMAFYQNLLTRSHTMRDNPIGNRETVAVVGVDDKLVLGEGHETLELYTLSEGHADDGDMIVLYRPHDKTLYFADLYNSGFGVLQNFFPNLATTIQERAQMLVDFVDEAELDVETIAPLHGDVWNDNRYESVKAAADFFNQ